jgi:hypothetical protein
MFRTTRLFLQLLIIVWSLGLGGKVGAQVPWVWEEDLETFFDHDLIIAQARFRADQAKPEQLARARLQAVRVAQEARFKQFEFGKQGVTCEFLITWSQYLFDSDRAVQRKPGDQVAAFERNWLRATQIEEILTRKLQGGMDDITESSPARYFRLDAEIRLAQARHKNHHHAWEGETHNPTFLDDPLHAGNRIGKAQREAMQTRSDALARERKAVARAIFQARAKQFIEGRQGITSEFVGDASKLLLESELALSLTPSDRRAALERHWVRAKTIEKVGKVKYEAAMDDITVYLPPLYDRLGAELKWAQVRTGKEDGPGAPGKMTTDPYLRDFSPLSWKELAQAHFQATRAEIGNLARSRLAAAELGLEAQFKQFAAGRQGVTAEFLFSWAQRMSEAKLSFPLKREERIAALEQLWQQAFECERIGKSKYKAGKDDITVYAPALYFRLAAEIRLAEARSKK